MSKILIVSAHPDDIEFAMGGTLNRLAKQKHEIQVHVMSDSGTIQENKPFDLRKECNSSIKGLFGVSVKIADFETMYFRDSFQKIRNHIYQIKQKFNPDVVFSTSPMSAHPDHQVVGESCDSIFLESSLFCMEDVRGNQKQLVNKWAILDETDVKMKIKSLECYKSQNSRTYMANEQIKAMAKSRGLQIGKPYAEGFEVIRDISNLNGFDR